MKAIIVAIIIGISMIVSAYIISTNQIGRYEVSYQQGSIWKIDTITGRVFGLSMDTTEQVGGWLELPYTTKRFEKLVDDYNKKQK